MSVEKKAEFFGLVDQYINLEKSLSREELEALELWDTDSLNKEKYSNQFFLGKSRGEEDDLARAQKGVDHITGMINDVKEELKRFKEKKEMLRKKMSPIELFNRYLNLNDHWRVFICTRVDLDLPMNREDADRKIAELFGNLSKKFSKMVSKDMDQDGKDFLKNFSEALDEIERELLLTYIRKGTKEKNCAAQSFEFSNN